MHFIEELLRISPDNGSGTLELTYFFAVCLGGAAAVRLMILRGVGR